MKNLNIYNIHYIQLFQYFKLSVFLESIFSIISHCLHSNTNIHTCLNKVTHQLSFSFNERTINSTN